MFLHEFPAIQVHLNPFNTLYQITSSKILKTRLSSSFLSLRKSNFISSSYFLTFLFFFFSRKFQRSIWVYKYLILIGRYPFYSLITFLYLWENVPWSYYIKFIFVQNLKLENLQLRMDTDSMLCHSFCYICDLVSNLFEFLGDLIFFFHKRSCSKKREVELLSPFKVQLNMFKLSTNLLYEYFFIKNLINYEFTLKGIIIKFKDISIKHKKA